MHAARSTLLKTVATACAALACLTCLPSVARGVVTASGTEGSAPTVVEATEERYGDAIEPAEVSEQPEASNVGEVLVADGGTGLPNGDGEQAEDAASSVRPRLRYMAHVQNRGWQDAVFDGDVAGTVGLGLRLEALCLDLLDAEGNVLSGSLRYRVFVQGEGWQDWVCDGEEAGSTGESRRIEALRISIADDALAERFDVCYRVHVQNWGWLAWAQNGDFAGSLCEDLRVEAVQALLVEKGSEPPTGVLDPPSAHSVAYVGTPDVRACAHVQNVGWQAPVGSGSIVGTTGRGLRLEAFRLTLGLFDPDDGGVAYEAHVQNEGWQGERADGELAGTTGRSLRVEAVRIWLTGAIAREYHVYYRAHLSNYGWLGWGHDGMEVGSESLARRLEAIEVRLVREGEEPPSDLGYVGESAFVRGVALSYGMLSRDGQWRDVTDGGLAGTTGMAMPADCLRASILDAAGFDGTVEYAVSDDGSRWETALSGGAPSGTQGTAARAVRLSLTGSLARLFDLYYRVHLSNYGWLEWARDGEVAGNAGFGLAVEGVEMRLVPKGDPAPGGRSYHYFDTDRGSIGQLSMHANARQRRAVLAARLTPTPGGGLCALWISQVISRAGFGYHGGNACDQYRWWCHLTRKSDLKIGMIVAVPTHSHTTAGRIWGHVCIYVGDGMVMDNVGSIRTMKLVDWLSWYGDLASPKWGWLGNQALA